MTLKVDRGLRKKKSNFQGESNKIQVVRIRYNKKKYEMTVKLNVLDIHFRGVDSFKKICYLLFKELRLDNPVH